MFLLQHTYLGFFGQPMNDYRHKGQTKHEDRQILDRKIIDRKMGKDRFFFQSTCPVIRKCFRFHVSFPFFCL